MAKQEDNKFGSQSELSEILFAKAGQYRQIAGLNSGLAADAWHRIAERTEKKAANLLKRIPLHQ